MLKTSRDAEAAARAAYDMATTGARDEDKEAATALVSRASGAIAEVNAYLGETRLVAPLAGEVYKRNVEPGEIVAAGLPDPDAARSDRRVGDVPGPRGQAGRRADRAPELPSASRPSRAAAPDLTVYYIAPAGDFATWRATSAQGGFDLKTFEVRARPASPVPGLRPGMSVILEGR